MELRLREIENALAHRLRRLLHRPAGDVGLARGRGRARGADPRVGVEHHDVVDAQLAARDLGLDHDDPLPDLGGGGMDFDAWLAFVDEEADAGGRVVVEAFGVADVLEAGRVADAALHALAVRGVGHPAGQKQLAPLTLALSPWREREIAYATKELGYRDRAVDL